MTAIVEKNMTSSFDKSKPRWRSIAYWLLTLLFAAAISVSAVLGLIGDESFLEIFETLGYPKYLLVILGVAKLLGAGALLQNRWPRLKEWAYAGFTFDVLGAALSYLATGDYARIAIPAGYLIVLAGSYLLWRSQTTMRVASSGEHAREGRSESKP